MNDPLLGSVLAGYRIVRRVGRGGMGVVYEAVDLTLDRAVALKLIAPERAAAPEYRERFATEARVAASIEHPHVVPVFGAGEEDGQLFLVMRFVAGEDLGTVVAADGPLPPERAARILMQVASALEAVHERGLVHRDVKPANVLLGPDDHAFLTDFGVAKQPFADGHTQAGEVVGTPDYVAPEQIRGEPLGPHTDIYALGGLLFFTLTGRVAFPLEHTEAKLWAHLREPPPTAPAFDEIVGTALAKDPRKRYPSAAAFEHALRRAARGEAADRVETARRTWRDAESDLTALALQRESAPTTGAHGICPFKGLATFEFDDASYFFGRERIVAELVARLVGAPLLAIVGASGSGKSSLLRAGLLPALAAGVLPGSERWSHGLLRPGAHPLAEFERVGEPAVLAVDQFEETFTACRSEEERMAFVDALTRRREGVVIIAVRGDYYERCALYPALSQAMAGNQVLVAPMRRDELRQTIERPAERAGLRVEPELVDALLADVEAEPGGLPLLSTALLELWQHRRGDVLQLATYERTGGVRRAVARLAEEAFEQLDESDQAQARRLLLRLAGEGAGDAVVRRRVPLDELDEDLQRVAAVLARRRLLTVSAGAVEVAHEALLREWPRLRGWLEQDAEGRRLHRRLGDAAREWDERGRDPGDLYRAARLAAAVEWQGAHDGELGATERAFLAAGRDAEAHELALAKRRTRRLRVLAGGLAVLAVIAGASAVLAVRQSARVEAERRTAVSRGLAAQAVAKLEEAPDVAALLGLEAYRSEPTIEARSAVLGSLPRLTPQTGVLRGHSGYVAALQFRRDGRMLVSGGEDGTARVWDTRTRRQVHVLRPVGRGVPVTGLAYDPGGAWLAVSIQAGTFSLWDLDGSPRVGPPQGGYERAISTVASSPRANLLAAGSFFGTVRFWDGRTQRELSGRTAAPTDAPVSALAFSPDGRTLIVGTADGAVRRWDPSTRELIDPPLVRRGGRIDGLAFSARGDLLAVAGADGAVRIWDARSWQPEKPLHPRVGAVHAVAFAPRGTTLAVAGEDASVRRWDPRSGRPLEEPLVGHTGPATGVAFSADGTLASAGADGTIRLWAADAGDAPLDGHSGPVSSLDFSADGRWLASGSEDRTVQVWDAAARRRSGPALKASGAVSGVAFGERDLLAIATARGRLEFWAAGRRLGASRDADVGPIAALATLGNRLRVAGETSVATWDMGVRRESAPLIAGHGGDIITDVAVDPTGRLVATASEDWTVRLWDAARHRPHGAPLAGHTLAVRKVAFSADGKLVATAGEDGTVRLWDAEKARPRGQPLLGHRTAVTGVAFNRGGTTLASADGAGAVRLWDVATRRQLGRPLTGHGEGVTTVRFSPDGRLLASAGADGKVRLWPSIVWSSDLRALLRHVCAVVGRSLSRAEWREYRPDQGYRETCP